jgi:alkanesulfonate monooxygenase SsuD/methylene tetrahydromethanopterin reductase-like flavin-dependent oxidoreductase (luciferase family)
VEFALFVDLQLPRPWTATSEKQLVDEAIEQVELADALGYDCVWAQEHHFLEEYCHSSAPEVLLAAMAARTKRIRLGHGVAVMSPRINHPVRVAERIAMLDLVSGGRVEWGTGESGTRTELEAFGVPFVEKRAMWLEGVREASRMLSQTPYPGHEGRYFAMPARNVVPKPLQKPHPPLWAACSNRESLRLAARLGLGALTFAFIDAAEARFWVEEYYETFRNECRPISEVVNPKVAMLTGFHCHEDAREAAARGLEGAQFFGFGLMHYWRDGVHEPAATNVWELFKAKSTGDFASANKERTKAGMLGIGDPDGLAAAFAEYEAAGVDQLILLQQAGNYPHEHVCASLELFGKRVLPKFKERESARRTARATSLERDVEAALSRREVPEPRTAAPVVAYPLAWSASTSEGSRSADRRPGASAFWRAQVGGLPKDSRR